MPSKQETFNIVARHLLAQGLKSLGPDGEGCAYRGDDGWLKCAAGVLIPDGDYDPDMEGFDVHCSLVRPVLERQGHDLDLAHDLQVTHDEFEPEEWPDKLREVADSWGLTMPEEVAHA